MSFFSRSFLWSQSGCLTLGTGFFTWTRTTHHPWLHQPETEWETTERCLYALSGTSPAEELQGWWWSSGLRSPTARYNSSSPESETVRREINPPSQPIAPSAQNACWRTHRADVQVVQAGHLQPLTKEVLLHTGLCLEDGQRNGSDGHKHASFQPFGWQYKVHDLHPHSKSDTIL